MKRLKYIEDKNEEFLKTTKNKTENIKETTDSIKEPLIPEAIDLYEEIKSLQENVGYKKLKFAGGNNIEYDFSNYKTFNDFFNDIHCRRMTIDQAEIRQNNFNNELILLNDYSPKSSKYKEAKNNLLNNAKKFYDGRQKIIEGFKNGLFSLKSDDEFEEQLTSKKPTKIDVNKLNELIIKKETGINRELFKNHFGFQTRTVMLKNLYKLNDKNNNNNMLMSMIKSGLSDL